MEFYWVTPQIAIGGQLEGEQDVKFLLSKGITDILDSNDQASDAPLLANSLLVYSWNPTKDDGKDKPLWYWDSTLRFALPTFVQPGRRIYFHCKKGHNRGPSNAAITMMALGWSKYDALTRIRAANPEATTRYIDNAADAVQKLGFVQSLHAPKAGYGVGGNPLK